MHVGGSAPQMRWEKDRYGAQGREFPVEAEMLLRVLDSIANDEDSNKKDVYPKYCLSVCLSVS